MDQLSAFYPQLLLVVAAVLVALALAPWTHRLGLPEPAAFLAVGLAIGSVRPEALDPLTPQIIERIGAVALFVVLFGGGIATGGRAFRRSIGPIALLGLPGTAVTAGGLALVGMGLGLDSSTALLVGVALAPTDPAAVYAALRGSTSETRARTVLEGESGFNDPIGITFMAVAVIALSGDGVDVLDGAARLGRELGLGIVGGLLGGLALRRLTGRLLHLDDAVRPVALIGAAVVLGSATSAAHGSGFLAVYLSGLLVADRWETLDETTDRVIPALSAVAEPMLFALLGAAFVGTLTLRDTVLGVALATAGALLVRPLVAAACLAGSGLTRGERLLVSWGGLKGAVPLLLAAFPALERLDGARRVEAIVLAATTASILIQGASLGRVAARTVPDRRAETPAPA